MRWWLGGFVERDPLDRMSGAGDPEGRVPGGAALALRWPRAPLRRRAITELEDNALFMPAELGLGGPRLARVPRRTPV